MVQKGALMGDLAIWMGAGLLAALALILLWLGLRRRARSEDPQRALRDMAKERKKRRRGTIRGKGGGGSSGTMYDASSGLGGGGV